PALAHRVRGRRPTGPEAAHAAAVAQVPEAVAAQPRVSRAPGLQTRAGHTHSHRGRGLIAMPKVLSESQVTEFEQQGFRSPVRVMTPERAAAYRARFESLETRFPGDIKKMKTKSHLLCPWVLDIAEDPHILDIFEDLIGPNLRCWSMAWRVKKADGETF